MKRILSMVIVLAMMLSMGVQVLAAPAYGSEWEGYYHSATTTYSDVPSSHWAYNAIMRTTEKNWFSGYPDGSFRPNNSIKRAEALKVFVEFLGLELKDVSESTYYDVDPNVWYAPYIEAGKDLFPVHTTIQGKKPFNPEMPVTREDTVYALTKALGCDQVEKYIDQSVLNMFTDKNSISDTIKPYMSVALKHELVSGFPDNTIRGQSALTRAEFATLLFRGTEHGTHELSAKIDSVTVTPEGSVEMEIGETVTLKARAVYTDNKNQSYTDLQPYEAENAGVISLNGTTITAVKEGRAVIKYNDSYLKNEALTVIVKKPSEAPNIKISNYSERTKEKSVTFTGIVTDKTGTEIDLTCNGKDIIQNGNSFTLKVDLSVGENKFVFTAVNGYGNQTTKTITIILEEEEKQEEIKENEWVGWTDSLPSYVNSSEYIIEEKTQYRFQKKETTTSSSSSMLGWTLIEQTENWSSWSSWSQNAAYSSSTREVDTKTVADPVKYKTQWHYTRYYGWNSSKGGYVSWPWKGTYSKTYQESGWRDSPLENRGRADDVDATCYKDPGDPINIWWWNETTRTVACPETYHTEYRYRDKTTTYHFEKKGSWSDWQDSEVAKDNNTNVETRKAYRYKLK